jgi:phospholipase/lecithinase/hemolysin
MSPLLSSSDLRRLTLAASFVLLTVASAHGATYSAIYAFGDSLSDLGNTYNALGGTASDEAIYYELGYTTQPGRYDNGRWSNGPLWIEHVNSALGLPTLRRNDGIQNPFTHTNYAFGGSESGSGHLDLGLLPNLLTQIQTMTTLSLGSVPQDGLYSVWSGGNDVINYILDGEPNTPAGIDTLTTTMAGNISTAMTNLYNAGARHMIVPNLPALGDKPSFVNTPNQAFANDIVTSYNPKLADAITDFRTAHPDATITSWDVYTQFQDMLANPGSYGFTNTEQAALNNSGLYPGVVSATPNTHVFWDGTHPTEVGHQILGQSALEALGVTLTIPEPTTLVLLSVGSIAMCSRRSRRPGRMNAA